MHETIQKMLLLSLILINFPALTYDTTTSKTPIEQTIIKLAQPISANQAMKKNINIDLLLAENTHTPSSHKTNPHWEYQGKNGPRNWSKIKPEFSKCGEGLNQSPIDIRPAIEPRNHFNRFSLPYKANNRSLQRIEFHYSAGPGILLNNGHTIQFNVDNSDFADYMVYAGERYELIQFHFHAPSEHVENGRYYDMEIHLVHKNRHNELAVVGLLVRRGGHNQLIDALWHSMPTQKGQKNTIKFPINVIDLIPFNRAYYHYNGSLTTPPCSEKVKWFVMRDQIYASYNQINYYKSIIKNNSRPPQKLNGRRIMESR